MRLARVMRDHAIPEFTQQLIERRRASRRIRRDVGEEPSCRVAIQRAVRRLIAQRRQVGGDEIRDLATDALHRRVVEVERGAENFRSGTAGVL